MSIFLQLLNDIQICAEKNGKFMFDEKYVHKHLCGNKQTLEEWKANPQTYIATLKTWKNSILFPKHYKHFFPYIQEDSK